MPPYVMQLDPTFFPRYDELGKELQQLEGVETLLQDAQAQLARERQALATSHDELQTLQSIINEQQSRIRLCQTHCVYGNTLLQPQLWLRGGTTGKIQRAQAKLELAQQQQGPLEALMEQLKDNIIPPLESRVTQLQLELEHQVFLKEVRSQMRELALELNPSRTSKSLQEQIQAQQLKVEQINAAVQAAEKLVQECVKVKECYQKAEAHLQDAKNLNRGLSSATVASNDSSSDGNDTPTSTTQCATLGCPYAIRQGSNHPHCCDRCSVAPNEHGLRCEKRIIPQSTKKCASRGCPFVARTDNSFCCDRCSIAPKEHGRKCEKQLYQGQPTMCASRGCQFAAHSNGSGFCCARCSRSPNRHGPHCERQSLPPQQQNTPNSNNTDLEEHQRVHEVNTLASIEARREKLKRQARNSFRTGATTLQRALLETNLALIKTQYPALCHPLERTAALDFRTVKNSTAGLERTGVELWENSLALQRELQQEEEMEKDALCLKQAAKEDEMDRILRDLRLFYDQEEQKTTSTSAASPPRAVAVVAASDNHKQAAADADSDVPVVVAHPVDDHSDDNDADDQHHPRDPPINTAAAPEGQLPSPIPSAPYEKVVE